MLQPLIKLNAKVEIGPSVDPEHNITPYVISINRSVTMCSIEGEITIELSPDIFDYLNSINYTIHTYHKIQVKEFGIKTFYGYISSVRFARIPHKVCIIKAFDIYKLAKDTLIVDETEVTNGESISYWLSHLAELAGISFFSDNTSVTDLISPTPGISFNYRTVDSAMQDVTSFSNGYLYTDANATLHFKKGLITDETYIVSGGDFQYYDLNYPSGIWHFSGGNTYNASWDMSDKMSRNVAKVWGFKGNVTLLPGESPYILSTNYGWYPLPVNRTVLYSSTMVQTQEEADRISAQIMSDLSRSTSIKTFEITGNPKIKLCRDCYYWVDLRLPGIHGHGPVTSIQTILDKTGYKTTLKIDEFCPKFGGWALAPDSLNTLWIAGSVGPLSTDPIQQKLIWCTDFGLGGEPTYNIVKNIPPGIIIGMDATRNNTKVFLLLYEINVLDPSLSTTTLWAGKPDLIKLNQSEAWTKILTTGDSLSNGYIVSEDFENKQPFYAIQTMADALHFSVTGVLGGIRRTFYCEYKNNVLTTIIATFIDTMAGMTTNTIFGVEEDGVTYGYDGITSTPRYAFASFNNPLPQIINGTVLSMPPTQPNRVGGTWLGSSGYDYLTVPTPTFPTLTKIMKNNTTVYSDLLANANFDITLRGDYGTGTQVQFVKKTTLDNGELYISIDGTTFNLIESWKHGIVECTDARNSSIMGWFSNTVEPSQEVARVTLTGNIFTNATGNWWGTSSEILSGEKVQVPDSNFYLINVRATFFNYLGIL